MLGIDLESDMMLEGYPVGWYSPTYKMLLEVWRELTQSLAPYIIRKNVQERRIETINGGIMDMWSLDNPDTSRGRKYARVVIDEAAMIPGLMDTWQHVIRPTLLDYKGDGFLLSTPKGRNAFWQMFQWGIDDNIADWSSWQMPTNANPYIDQAEIDDMRSTMPEQVFRQEILAEFIEDGAGVFRRVSECAIAIPETEAPLRKDGSRMGEYLIAVDWGKHHDFTVLTVFNLGNNSMVHMDRFNQIDYTVQVNRLVSLYEKFAPVTIIAERNSMGDPLIEQLQRRGLPVQPFNTTNATKARAVDDLALAFERGDIKIINDPVLISEHQAYEMERLPSGLMRYNAPSGMHDDTVMSTAIGWQGVLVMSEPAQSNVVIDEYETAISPY